MSDIMELVNSFDPNSKEYNDFMKNLLSSSTDIPYSEESMNALQNHLISIINKRLNEAVSHHDKLILLDLILDTLSDDLISKHGILWITKITQMLEKPHIEVRDVTLACKVGGNLISRLKIVPDIQKQISTQNVKHLITAIINLENNSKCVGIYYLLATLLYHYPESCEKLQIQIKTLLLRQLDTADNSTVHASAKCYTLLVRAVERTFKPPPTKSAYTAWLYSELCICNNLYSIISELFSFILEVNQIDTEDQLELPPIPEDNIIEYYNKQKTRFLNLCTYLSMMLRGFGHKNSVNPNDILKLLCRGLAIHSRHCGTENVSRIHNLYLILPKLHIGLFDVLESFIHGFKQELLPHAHTILRLCEYTVDSVRTLESKDWTFNPLYNRDLNSATDTTISGNKKFRSVRIAMYKCLTSWLMYTGSSSGAEIIYYMSLYEIWRNILPHRDRILLNSRVNTKHLSKKALKRVRESNTEKSQDPNEDDISKTKLSPDLCEASHILLQHIISSVGCWLKLSDFKNIQNMLLVTSHETYFNPSEKYFYQQHTSCRLQLLRSLRVLLMHPYPKITPPIQYSIDIFEMALNDSDINIVQEAKTTLTELQKILHPSAPTLQLSNIRENGTEHNGNDQDGNDVVEFNDEDMNVNQDTSTSLKNKRAKLTDREEDKVDDTNSDGSALVHISSQDLPQINSNDETEIIELNDENSHTVTQETSQKSNTNVERMDTNEDKEKIINLACEKSESKKDDVEMKMPDHEEREEEQLLNLFHDETKDS